MPKNQLSPEKMASIVQAATRHDTGYFYYDDKNSSKRVLRFTNFDCTNTTLFKKYFERVKIAGFDLDHTVITTSSGNVFSRRSNDWKFLYPNTVDKLIDLHEKDEYLVCFFSNQKGLNNSEALFDMFVKKMRNVFLRLSGVPVQMFIALADNHYRKPYTGMWDLAYASFDKINMEECFFVGDAAGRPGDHSDVDRLFAENLNIKFYTPEVFFGQQNYILAEQPLNVPPKKKVGRGMHRMEHYFNPPSPQPEFFEDDF